MNFADGLVFLCSSLLDCFRSPRPPCSGSQGRGCAYLRQGRPAHGRLGRSLLRHPPVRQAPAQDHVQGVAGGLQRIRSGMFSDLQLEDTSYTNGFFLQREKINPIYGISAEGYEGKGFVQSPPAEKQ